MKTFLSFMVGLLSGAMIISTAFVAVAGSGLLIQEVQKDLGIE